MHPSWPLEASNLPSGENTSPPVQVSAVCAFLTSIAGLEYGPWPAYTTKLPSNTTLAIKLDPCSGVPAHASEHILLLPPFPVLLLCTITSLCDLLLFTSHRRIVLSADAVATTFGSTGDQHPAVISATCPFVLCISRRYMSPFTNSTSSKPSREYSFAWVAAGITSMLWPESRCENVALWTWCDSEGSFVRNGYLWSDDIAGKSKSFME